MAISDDIPAALVDLREGIQKLPLALMFGWQDVARRYRRSKIGAFWLSINMMIMIGAIGTIFGALFKSPIATFLPHLAVGLVLWNFISNTIMEMSLSYISSEGMILQVKMPLSTHLFRVMYRNIVVLIHNIIIIPIVMLFFRVPAGHNIFMIIPGFFILLLVMFPIGLITSILCTRFRDMSQVIQNILQLSFYITPIMWFAHALPGGSYNLVLIFNPFFHLLSIIRGPILGETIEPLSWAICVILAGMLWLIAIVFFARFKNRIPFWL